MRMFYSISLVIMIFLFLGARLSLPSGWLLSYLFSVNVTVGLLMAYDKLAAIRGLSRVPEKVLHLYALIGGTPVAFLSQKLFRHKTIKRSFQKTFHIILAIQILVISVWFLWK